MFTGRLWRSGRRDIRTSFRGVRETREPGIPKLACALTNREIPGLVLRTARNDVAYGLARVFAHCSLRR